MRIIVLTVVAALMVSAGALGSAQTQPLRPPSPTSQASIFVGSLTAAERERVIEALADALQARYFDPEMGDRYANVIRANLAQGTYDAVVDPTAFCERVTADLQSVSKDAHLRLAPEGAFRVRRSSSGEAPVSARESGPIGMEETRMIGDVAYLRFNAFPDQPAVAERARRFLLAHADAKAVIIDVRPNRGGGIDVMGAILPLLYAQPTTLVRMDVRRRHPTSSDLRPAGCSFAGLLRRPSCDTTTWSCRTGPRLGSSMCRSSI